MPNSLLSRASSAVSKIKRDHALGAEMDHQIDGGEWSAAAHDRKAFREIKSALAEYGFTPREYNTELARRTSTRFAHFSNLYAE